MTLRKNTKSQSSVLHVHQSSYIIVIFVVIHRSSFLFNCLLISSLLLSFGPAILSFLCFLWPTACCSCRLLQVQFHGQLQWVKSSLACLLDGKVEEVTASGGNNVHESTLAVHVSSKHAGSFIFLYGGGISPSPSRIGQGSALHW